MNKIKNFQVNAFETLEIIQEHQMLKVKGGIEDKRNRPGGAKPNKKKGG